jgi:hypothetical protein
LCPHLAEELHLFLLVPDVTFASIIQQKLYTIKQQQEQITPTGLDFFIYVNTEGKNDF